MGLTYSSVIDADRDEVFSWHTRPGAIIRLIPPWQPVRVLREAGSLRDGRATLTLPGGLRWVAAHQPDGYDPPNAFADELTSLPLPWRHTHQFSQYVLPERLTGAGHRFRQPELTGALRHLFGRDGT